MARGARSRGAAPHSPASAAGDVGRRSFLSHAALAGAGALVLSPPTAAHATPEAAPYLVITRFGATGTGRTDDAAAIQRAIDAVDQAGRGGVVCFPPGQYLVTTEIQLRANNLTILMWGAEILGPTHGTPAGGLMSVIDRRDPSRVLANVTVQGGLFTPQHPRDNGLCVGAGHRVLFHGCRVNLARGQRGFAIQPVTPSKPAGRRSAPSPGALVRAVQLVGCASYGGGENGLDIESVGGDLIADVQVEGMHLSGCTDAAIRCSAGGGGHRLSRILLSNIIISDVAQGLWYADVHHGLLQGIVMDVGAHNHRQLDPGIRCGNAVDCVLSSIVITGRGPGNAIALVDGRRVRVSGFSIVGSEAAFSCGVWNGSHDATIGPGSISGCATGVHCNSPKQRAVYTGLEFDASCRHGVDAYLPQSAYVNLVERAGDQARLVRRDGS